MSTVKDGGSGCDDVVMVQEKYGEIPNFPISPTITSTEANTTYLNEKQRLRRLTPKECTRLQGFPEDFKFPVSDTQAYKQMGNTVTVNVIEAIGRRLNEVLDGTRPKDQE